ncbi:MAG: hypothetical protein OSW77_07275, partial [Proteobacteria bacterium]|nr:hypothetical protein [Pseudomonadota bacterium]
GFRGDGRSLGRCAGTGRSFVRGEGGQACGGRRRAQRLAAAANADEAQAVPGEQRAQGGPVGILGRAGLGQLEQRRVAIEEVAVAEQIAGGVRQIVDVAG